MTDLRNFISGDAKRDMLYTSLIPNPEGEFCYSEIAPRSGQAKRDGKIKVIPREDKIEDESSRTDNIAAKDIGDLNLKEQSYNCNALDRRKFISNAELKHNEIEDNIIKEYYSQLVVDKINRLKEKKLATLIQDASKYDSVHKATLTGTDQFTHASSKPIDYIINKAMGLYKATGFMPDSLFFPAVTWNAIITNASVKAELAYTKDKVLTIQDVMPLLKTGFLAGLQNIIIGRAVYDKATKKDPKDKTLVDRDFLWIDSAIIFKKAKPIENTNLVEAGFVVSVESEDPEDLGYLEYKNETDKLKGIYVEQRYSHDIMNCGVNETYFDNAYLLIDTNA